MNDEYDALIENETWELVPRPHNVNVICSMWIFTRIHHSNGNLERHKARHVVNGRSEQVGIDCEETFSLVVKPATIGTVLSLACLKSEDTSIRCKKFLSAWHTLGDSIHVSALWVSV